MTEKTIVHQFLPGAQSWGPAAELGSASNALPIFSHLTLAASQGKASELAPVLGSLGQRGGEDCRLPFAVLQGHQDQSPSHMSVVKPTDMCILSAEGSLGDTFVGQKFQNLSD